jgi:hypothetical protein
LYRQYRRRILDDTWVHTYLVMAHSPTQSFGISTQAFKGYKVPVRCLRKFRHHKYINRKKMIEECLEE